MVPTQKECRDGYVSGSKKLIEAQKAFSNTPVTQESVDNLRSDIDAVRTDINNVAALAGTFAKLAALYKAVEQALFESGSALTFPRDADERAKFSRAVNKVDIALAALPPR